MDYTILLIDDELEMCLSLADVLKAKGYATLYTTNPLDVTGILKQARVDLIIMDIKMPEMSGIDLLKVIKKHDSTIAVIMITGYPTVENAVRAMKYGALNFYVKPLTLAELLKEIKELAAKASRKQSGKKDLQYTIITREPAIQDILETIENAAPTTAPVLITGESGTGKELVANSLQHLSPRAKHPFVKVNCAALPDDLLESELFGHERGAFTGAVNERKGRFELADKGTIFLDEIGDMRLKTQAKILRVIQEQEFERLGSTKTIKCDVRIVAATNKNLDKLVEENRFREDLYYRLKVIPIEIPPLRDRRSDIPLLIHHFLDVLCKVKKKKIRGISKKVMKALGNYDWPGNVRELENIVERMVILSEDDYLDLEDLPEKIAQMEKMDQTIQMLIPDEGFSLSNAINEYERQLILNALEKADWVKNRAAKLLNMNRTTLVEKIKKQGIDRLRAVS